MTVELSVIENLGLKMYVTIPPVIAEMIANSWDADAHNMEIELPIGPIDERSEIVIEDNGLGMSYDDISSKFLRIGRKRREEGGDTSPNGRRLIGRKGIGKLAPFGVAKIVEVETCQNHVANSLIMDIDRMLEAGRMRCNYFPQAKKVNEAVGKEHGTRIVLKSLNRRTSIDIDAYRRTIARRFSIIGRDFEVKVNRTIISPEDWLKPEDMQYVWRYQSEPVSPEHPDWVINGWVGTARFPLPEEQRGVIIMARGKLVQDTPFYFGVAIGEKYSYAYITGILHAEFLDAEEDLVATHRGSVVWESTAGTLLTDWGKRKLLEISRLWQENRRKERESVIREDLEFKSWLQTLPAGEAKIADKVIKALTTDEHLTDERRKELARFMRNSFEQQVFQEMVAALPDNPEDASLIEVFEEWGIIEAREILRIVRGRMATIRQFVKFVKEDAKEKPTIHNFFRQWPWLIDPTWTQWSDEVYFSQILRENYPDDSLEEADRRIDFVCIGAGDTVHVVELKRPSHKIDAKDLEQLLAYVGFVRDRLGNAPERNYRDASGYIIGGGVSNDSLTKEKIKALYGVRMYVRRYDDLIVIAQRLHDDFDKKLQEFEKIKEAESKKQG
jgi:hypothetical protein